MDWKRGLLRIWLVLAVIWILAVGSILPSAMRTAWDFRDVPTETRANARAAASTGYYIGDARDDNSKIEATKELGRRLNSADAAFSTFLWAGLIPPFLALAVGTALWWAVKGFKKPSGS